MTSSIITLTTDFGTGSPYVAQMKGVILSLNAAVTLVDLTHDIPPQDIRRGALVLEEVAPRFPPGTLHVAVVDPGVGTARRIIYARLGSQDYLAPDNGLLSRLAVASGGGLVREVTNRQYWLRQVSDTFHGRDILAPVAAHLSLGVPPERLGPLQAGLEMLDWPTPLRAGRQLTGVVLASDTFGNLITNLELHHCAEISDWAGVTTTCAGHTISGLVRTYGARPAGSLVALFGSSGKLELAVVGGHAAQQLQATVGQAVHLAW